MKRHRNAAGGSHAGWCSFSLLLAALTAPAVWAQSTGEHADDATLRSYLAGNGLLQRGLYEPAVVEYRQFLAEHSNHAKAPVARYGVAVALFRLGKLSEARTELAALEKLSGFAFTADVAVMLGECHLAEQRYADAARCFERAASAADPKQELAPAAAARRIEALYLGAQTTEIAELAQRFAQTWPDAPNRDRVEYYAGLARLAAGEPATAAEHFAALLAHCESSSLADPARLLLAQSWHHAGKTAEAAEAYRAVLARPDSSTRADALYGLAALEVQAGRPAAAAEPLDALLAKHADHTLAPQARLLRGRVSFELGQLPAARAMLEPLALAEGPLAIEAGYWLARCELGDGDARAAAQRLAKLRDDAGEHPLAPELAYQHAAALVQAGEFATAADALNESRALLERSPLAPDALYLLAASRHQQGSYAESLTACRTFAEKFPNHSAAAKVAFLEAENEFLAGEHEAALAACRLFLERYAQDPQAPAARFRMGLALYRLERFDEALPVLRAVAEAPPGQISALADAWLALGEIYFRRSEWKGAEESLARFVEAPTGVGRDTALLKLGLARQRQSRFEPALQAYEALLKQFEGSPYRAQAQFERGQCLVALEREPEALAALEAAASAGDPRVAAHAHSHLAALAIRRGDATSALARLDAVLRGEADDALKCDALWRSAAALLAARQYPEAAARFVSFEQQYPQHERVPAARASRAIALARCDRPGDALELMDQVEALPMALPVDLLATMLYEKAWCLRKTDRPVEAAEAYRRLLPLTGGGAVCLHARLELAELEAQAKRHDEAVKLLQPLLEEARREPASVPAEIVEVALYRLGVCEFERGQRGPAGERLREFLERFPDSRLVASALYFAGEAAFQENQLAAAAKHLDRLVAEFPQDPVLGPALLRLGEALAGLQRWARSEETFARYLERFPDTEPWYQARFGLGWAREHQGRHAEAIDAYREVTVRHKGSTAARAQFQIGECLFAQKQLDDAIRELLKVDILYAYPEWSAAALFEAGRCFEQRGQLGAAREQYQRITKEFAGSRWARPASERLAALVSAAPPGRAPADPPVSRNRSGDQP